MNGMLAFQVIFDWIYVVLNSYKFAINYTHRKDFP